MANTIVPSSWRDVPITINGDGEHPGALFRSRYSKSLQALPALRTTAHEQIAMLAPMTEITPRPALVSTPHRRFSSRDPLALYWRRSRGQEEHKKEQLQAERGR